MGPQTGELLATVTRSSRRVWGHPNKHFRKAKIASVIHLPCLPLTCSLGNSRKIMYVAIDKTPISPYN